MDPEQARALGAYLRASRLRAGISITVVAHHAGVARAQIMRIEDGTVASPRADVLAAFAETIGVEVADVYGLAGYTIPSELPSFTPYLRAKYRDLSDDAVAEMEAFLQRLRAKNGLDGPQPGEDEE